MSDETMFGRYLGGFKKEIRSILLGVVPGDSAKIKMADSCGGALWTSICKELKYKMGSNKRGFVTIVRRNGEIMGKEIIEYDYLDREVVTEYVYKYIPGKGNIRGKNVYVEVSE